MTQTMKQTKSPKAWTARHNFSTKTLAGLFPTATQVDKEIREIAAQRALRGNATPVGRDEAAAIITEAAYLGLRMNATTKALNLRWRHLR